MSLAVRRRVSIVLSVLCVVALLPTGTANADDGDPASYFGIGGLVFDDEALTSGATSGFPNSLVVAATDDAFGNIYVAFSGVVAGVVKYFFDGERDFSFGDDGVFTFPSGLPGSTSVILSDIVVREDGSIVVGGEFFGVGGGKSPTYAIVNPAGTAFTFPEPPPVFIGFGSFQRALASMVLLPDGRVLLAGVTEAGLGARVLEPNGIVWSALAIAHDPLNNPRGVKQAIALADGRVLVQISAAVGCQIFGLASSLSLDPTFGSNGVIAVPCGLMASEPAGSWLLKSDLPAATSLDRYTATGQLVTEFEGEGAMGDIGVDGTGRILIFDFDGFVAAYYPDLTVDESFGVLGAADVDPGAQENMRLMVSGDLLFYDGDSTTGITMQVLDDPYGIAPQPDALKLSSLQPLTPKRVLDTRTGLGAPQGKPPPGSTLDVQITGLPVGAGVPDDGSAVAVVLNVTSAEAASNGFVTVWPTGAARPTVSSLNYRATGGATPNMVTVPLGQGGRVSLYTNGSTQLLVDVLGYYRQEDGPVAAGRFQAVDPERVVDTRNGTGAPMAPVAPNGTLEVQLTGVAGVPSEGVSAVAFNLTSTRTLSNGFLTAYPTGSARPDTSNLNVVAGRARANFVISPVGVDGKVTIYTSAGGDILVDIVGWFTDDTADVRFDGLFVPISPRRIVDTRYGGAPTKPVNTVLVKQVGSTSVGPAYGIIGAAVVNLTVANPLQAGFISAWPTGIDKPPVSSLNVASDLATRANAAIVVLGIDDGGGFQVDFQTNAHLIVDMVGYYVSYAN